MRDYARRITASEPDPDRRQALYDAIMTGARLGAGVAAMGSLPRADGASTSMSSELVAPDAVGIYRLMPNSFFNDALWWWFAFTQMCGLIAIVLACWMFIQIACCRVPRALRRMKTWVDGIYRRFCGPAVADACAQVEIHDLEGTMVPGLKHLLNRFELATAGTRDVLER